MTALPKIDRGERRKSRFFFSAAFKTKGITTSGRRGIVRRRREEVRDFTHWINNMSVN